MSDKHKMTDAFGKPDAARFGSRRTVTRRLTRNAVARSILATLAAFGPLWPDDRAAQAAPYPARDPAGQAARGTSGSYVLGPDDEILVRGREIDEISNHQIRIDSEGYIRLPMAGRVKAAGLTPAELEAELSNQMKTFILNPEVSVSVVQFRSQPVSVLGAVRNPGVYQLEGRKTLLEILSLAGGLDRDLAGSTVKITRRLEWGRIPLDGARDDPNGEFSVAEVDVKGILDASNPGANIALKPHDVLTAPRAQLVYVTGHVQRPGGFVLHEQKTMTVLEALTLAGGTDRAAAPQHSRILRREADNAERTEIAVNVGKVLAGAAPDVPLLPDDILFVPSSAPKRAALRAIETAIQMGTGIVIFRR